MSDADGNVRYEVKAGVFKRLCRRAQQNVATNETRITNEVRRQKTEDRGLWTEDDCKRGCRHWRWRIQYRR